MKERKPIARNTPLKRGEPPRKVSKKRAKENRVRTKVVKEVMSSRFRCEAGVLIASVDSEHRCSGEVHDVHEPLTRARGGSITDANNMVVVCRWCHNWIHARPSLASSVGLLLS
jgi:hypothetical protein